MKVMPYRTTRALWRRTKNLTNSKWSNKMILMVSLIKINNKTHYKNKSKPMMAIKNSKMQVVLILKYSVISRWLTVKYRSKKKYNGFKSISLRVEWSTNKVCSA